MSSIPCKRQSSGSCGGSAFAFVTSRKKVSILPAGIMVIKILPCAYATYAQTYVLDEVRPVTEGVQKRDHHLLNRCLNH